MSEWRLAVSISQRCWPLKGLLLSWFNSCHGRPHCTIKIYFPCPGVCKRIHRSWLNDSWGGFVVHESNLTAFQGQSTAMSKGLSMQPSHSAHFRKKVKIGVTLLLWFCYDIILSRRTRQFNKEPNINVVVWKKSTNLPDLKMLLPEERENGLHLYSEWLPIGC